MDPRTSPELIELFRQELEERSSALVEAGRRLLVGELEPAVIEDVIRDAHTIKGSARLMADESLASAAEALEQGWRAIQEERLESTTEVVASLIDLAEQVRRSPDSDSPVALAHAVTRVSRAFGVSARHTSKPSKPDRGVLGGLLSTVTSSLMEGITRVDTGDLYRMINRLVEVSLDTSAVADLALVNLDGGDPKKMLTAWRSHLERISHSLIDLQEHAVSLANVPFREAAETFPQFIRYLGRKLGKDVRLELTGEDLELDRQIVEQLREPLRHLLVNAVDHGLETPQVRTSKGKSATGRVTIHARRQDDRLHLSVSDDGAGIDWEAVEKKAVALGLEVSDDLVPLLLRPDFSSRNSHDDFSGSGEGLSVVADMVARIHGGLEIESTPDHGTTVVLTLPISLVLQNVVVVAVGDEFWGVPEPAVLATMAISDPSVDVEGGSGEMRYEGHRVPVVPLAEALGAHSDEPAREVVVLRGRSGLVGISVPEVIERRRVAVKDLGPILEGAAHITAAAFLGGGEVLVVVDPHFLADYARDRPDGDASRPTVLVVDDAAGVRQLISATLNGAGFNVVLASDAREAVHRLSEAAMDVLVVDYYMPISSGVDLVKALRSADVTIPIVMVSGVANSEEQRAALEAGVDVYMDKFDLRKGVLTATLRRLLASRESAAS